MVSLDTFNDNLCLCRCITVHGGTRPYRSTQVARELAKSYFKFRTTPNSIPRTSLDELDKVERHLNQELLLSDWLRVRVYEPERQENGEILWHLSFGKAERI